MSAEHWAGSVAAPLAEVTRWVRSARATKEGAYCPCCDQRAQEYQRSIHAGMARALIRMYRVHGQQWQQKTVTLRGYGSAARDESLLRFWGLIEEATEKREDGGRAGWWRVTDAGAAFAQGRWIVRKYAILYDNRLLRFEGEHVGIRDCLGSRFNLDELLHGD